MKIRKFKLILLTVLFSLCFLTACSSKNDKIIESSTHYYNADIDNIEDESSVEISDTQNTEDNVITTFEEAKLIRVIDGDTIEVGLNNTQYSVRLIGINTPESVAPDSYKTKNSIEGTEASNTVKDILSDVKTVYLQKDVSDTDKYDRLLRYVWLEKPNDENDINEISTKMLNAILVNKGIAEIATYKPDTKYEWAFKELTQ
jgi:micrococcal nuclease